MLEFIGALELIPQSLRQAALDAAVDYLSNLGQGKLNDKTIRRIRKLRSDADFVEAYEVGLQQALDRFVREYTDQDEDLVETIISHKEIFNDAILQKALLDIIKNPGRYLEGEREIVTLSFDNVLPARRNRERVDRAIQYFLKCLAEEIWHLPGLRSVYELQFQKIQVETLREQLEVQKAQLQVSTDVQSALLLLTETIAEQKLLESGNKQQVAPSVMHNLPRPDYTRFVGRAEALTQIFTTVHF